jgi:protein TonB
MKKSNINRYRFIFFEVGLILALSFSLMAFRIEGYDRVVLVEPEEEPWITIVSDPYTAPPVVVPQVEKPKKPKYDEFIRNIKLINDKIRVEIPKKKFEPRPILHAPTKFISHKVYDRNAIEHSPDYMPEFPGGEKALMTYLNREVRYTEMAHRNGKEGIVWVEFIVDEEGNITDMKVLKDEVGFGCADIAVQAIRKMPRWIPGKKNGRNVKTRFIQSIRFELSF